MTAIDTATATPALWRRHGGGTHGVLLASALGSALAKPVIYADTSITSANGRIGDDR